MNRARIVSGTRLTPRNSYSPIPFCSEHSSTGMRLLRRAKCRTDAPYEEKIKYGGGGEEREESRVTGACKFLFFGIAEFLETESERVALIHRCVIVDVRDKIRIAIFVNRARVQELRFQ